MPDEAVSFGRQIDLVSSGLELNSIVQARRSRYVGGRVEDTIGMDDGIALARRYPELVNPTNWLFLEDTAGHMMRKRGMPVSSEWFSTAVLATGALDGTEQRIDIFARSFHRAEALDALSSVAPEHVLVLREVAEQLNKLEMDEDTYDELYARMGERPEYDLTALRDLAEIAFEEGDRLHLFRRMCELDKHECAGLGWELAWYGQDEEALATFERFVDETTSEIRVCNNASWLVNYYYANGREEEALTLAERASDVFCSFGIRTHAHLLERVGRVEQAEGWYRRDAGRYEYDAPVAPPLFGFYYRRARVAGDSAYEDRFESALAKTLPNGLEPLPEEPDAVGPTDGVLIDGDSMRLEWAGLRGSDVIVGVNGWRTHSLDQYDSILSFRDRTSAASDMKIRVWRQTRYIDLEANVRGRSLYVRMRTYGTPGPSYQWR